MKSFLFHVICLCLCLTTMAMPLKESNQETADSPISTIVIPYEPYTTSQLMNSKGKMQRVYVPLNMEIVPKVSLKEGEIAMGSQKGLALNVAEGAYPVYYMPGNANGKFQDKKIYLLE